MSNYNFTHPNPSHLLILEKGIDAWNKWRGDNPGTIPDLRFGNFRGMDLAGFDLSNVEFSSSNLQDANLHKSLLYQAELFTANLRNSDLTSTDMSGAKLHLTDLRGAKLVGAHLYRADFIDSLLYHTDFTNAICMTTTFSGVDLSNTIGLENIRHDGPSCVDFATIAKSGTGLSSVFLRGTGISDTAITHLPFLLGSDSQIYFYSCFISYSHKDEVFANCLYERLRSDKFRVWYAPKDLEPGQKLYEQIDKAIISHDKLLLVLSKNSIKSNWVLTELKRARRKETKEKCRILFPIRLMPFEVLKNWECFDSDSGKDLAMDVREYYISDFSNWQNPSSFESEYLKLRKALYA